MHALSLHLKETSTGSKFGGGRGGSRLNWLSSTTNTQESQYRLIIQGHLVNYLGGGGGGGGAFT